MAIQNRCTQSRDVHANCDQCGERPDVIHKPAERRGERYCGDCCPACRARKLAESAGGPVENSGDAKAALAAKWGLGTPIDVAAFLDRPDVPNSVKARVRSVGSLPGAAYTSEAAGAYQRMQAQVLLEVTGLARERGNPEKPAPKGGI